MIVIKDLRVAFGKNTVLEDLALFIGEGLHGIVGLNGAGKTTLLNTIFGNSKPEAGSIEYQGKALQSSQIGFLETSNFFYTKITGEEYLRFFQYQNRHFDIGQWNQLFGLPLGQLVETYSTGMKKKLAFMGVLCLDRSIMILDEPFNGVDLETYQQMKYIIELLKRQGKIILITSHILESLTALCDYIHCLEGKKIAFTLEKGDFDQLEAQLFQSREAQHKELIARLVTKASSWPK